jgi:hypothetical protein
VAEASVAGGPIELAAKVLRIDRRTDSGGKYEAVVLPDGTSGAAYSPDTPDTAPCPDSHRRCQDVRPKARSVFSGPLWGASPQAFPSPAPY